MSGLIKLLGRVVLDRLQEVTDEKCSCAVPHENFPSQEPCSHLRGNTIPWRNEVKYLGLVLDRKLAFKPQIKAVMKKAKSSGSSIDP